MATYITKYVTFEDIDLLNKLGNMLESEISQEIYDKCMEKKTFEKVEKKVWELMKDSDSEFAFAGYYEGLAEEWEAVDEHDLWSACLYNCDLLYMTAIAHVLGLQIPESSYDVKIFGII